MVRTSASLALATVLLVATKSLPVSSSAAKCNAFVASPSIAVSSAIPSNMVPSSVRPLCPPSSTRQSMRNSLALRSMNDPTTLQMAADVLTSHSLVLSSTIHLAYSDDPVGDLVGGFNGVIVGTIFAFVAAIAVSFARLLPSVGSSTFVLTEEEEEAVARVSKAYDAKDWEKEITEEGTKGYVNRRRLAVEAKEAYRNGVAFSTELKDRSLRYSETDLGFVARLLRAAEPNRGDVLMNLGSGTGRSTIACATLFPGFVKCIGVEFLKPLVDLSQQYSRKVSGKKASVEFRVGDIAEQDLSQADIVFTTATYFAEADLQAAMSTVQPGTKVMIIDRRLPGSDFQLLATVDDPSGDLNLNRGYLYEKK